MLESDQMKLRELFKGILSMIEEIANRNLSGHINKLATQPVIPFDSPEAEGLALAIKTRAYYLNRPVEPQDVLAAWTSIDAIKAGRAEDLSFVCSYDQDLIDRATLFINGLNDLHLIQIDLDTIAFDPQTIGMISSSFAEIYRMVPVACENNTFVVAVEEPCRFESIRDLEFLMNHRIIALSAINNDQIAKYIKKFYTDADEVAVADNSVPFGDGFITSRISSPGQKTKAKAKKARLTPEIHKALIVYLNRTGSVKTATNLAKLRFKDRSYGSLHSATIEASSILKHVKENRPIKFHASKNIRREAERYIANPSNYVSSVEKELGI